MEAMRGGKPECPMGRLIYMLSHQMKRRSFTQEDDWGLTMTQKHVLKFILMESLNRDIFQKDVEDGNAQADGKEWIYHQGECSAGCPVEENYPYGQGGEAS